VEVAVIVVVLCILYFDLKRVLKKYSKEVKEIPLEYKVLYVCGSCKKVINEKELEFEEHEIWDQEGDRCWGKSTMGNCPHCKSTGAFDKLKVINKEYKSRVYPGEE
jgi:transposase-like protein